MSLIFSILTDLCRVWKLRYIPARSQRFDQQYARVHSPSKNVDIVALIFESYGLCSEKLEDKDQLHQCTDSLISVATPLPISLPRVAAVPRARECELRTITEVRIERGIEIAMMTVLRQLPKKRRIISAVKQAAITASRITPLIAAFTNTD